MRTVYNNNHQFILFIFIKSSKQPNIKNNAGKIFQLLKKQKKKGKMKNESMVLYVYFIYDKDSFPFKSEFVRNAKAFRHLLTPNFLQTIHWNKKRNSVNFKGNHYNNSSPHLANLGSHVLVKSQCYYIIRWHETPHSMQKESNHFIT
jgi:hypothetical protein